MKKVPSRKQSVGQGLSVSLIIDLKAVFGTDLLLDKDLLRRSLFVQQTDGSYYDRIHFLSPSDNLSICFNPFHFCWLAANFYVVQGGKSQKGSAKTLV